jgi:predicted Zn-dependent protease
MQVEAYFDLLLWQNKCQEAEEFALKVASRLKLAAPKSPNRGLWLLHAGDAAFVCGNPSHALTLYQDSLQAGAPEHLVFTRLSDACFRLGDPAREREYREKLYGSLREDKARK